MDAIFKMKLHDVITSKPGLDYIIIRVPGGWIYRFSELSQVPSHDGNWSENFVCDSVFVPLNDGVP